MVSLSKIQKKHLIFDLVKKVSKSNNYLVREKDLSKILIEIDRESGSQFVLTPITEELKGLATPYLDSIFDDLRIFYIIKKLENEKDAHILTEEGNQYIKEKIAEMNLHDPQVYKAYSSIANKAINKYFNNKKK